MLAPLTSFQTDSSKDSPDAHCLPMGIAQMNAHPYPRKIIQRLPKSW